jgi:hypothetical protein
VNRAVAREMLDAGVEVLFQRADRAAFRRWMSSRDNTAENRFAWIDRSRLVRGSAALGLLGIKVPVSPRRQTLAPLPDRSPIGCWRRSARKRGGLIESGALLDSEELRLLPGWRSPDGLAELSFGAVRRVLLDMVDGKPPRDLPPGDTDELARRGFGVLPGLRIDWALPVDADAKARNRLTL